MACIVCSVRNNDDDKLIIENAKGKRGGGGRERGRRERELRCDDIGTKKMDRYRPPAERNAHSIFAYPMRIPGGHSPRRRPSKNNFQLPRARDRRAHAHALARMIRRVGRLLLLVPRCLFLFFHPLRRHPVSSSHPPIPHCRRYRPSAPPSLGGMHAAPRRPLFCFPLFSGFSGRAAPDTRAANRWCAAQQVADYKNHSAAPGAC